MPYQSVLGNNNVPAAKQAQYQSVLSGFVPGRAAQINAQIAAKNPANYKDVPSLNQALKAGVINQSQWMQQFKQLQPTAKGFSRPQNMGVTTAPTKFGLSAIKAYAPSVINQQDIQPIKNTFVGAYQKAVSQAKYLGGPTSTQSQRNAIITNQTKAASNPEYQKAITSLPKGITTSVSGAIQAQKMAASGAKAPEITAFLKKDAQAANQQTHQAINTLATVAGFSVPGEGIVASVARKAGLGKALGAAKAAIGKDVATNTLIDTQRAAKATKAATVADKLGSTSVKEANTTHIPVTEAPPPTKIPVTGKSTQVVGKVKTSSDAAYIKASNQLSAQYEKALAKIQQVPHPVAQQVLQRQLDSKYNALQEKLDANYGKSSIDFKGKPQIVKPTESGIPASALDRNPPTRFNSTRIAVTEPKTTPVSTTTSASKTATTTPTRPKVAPGEQQVSGSALRTEQKAVEAGMQSEAQGKATYTTVSHKDEAANAVKLLHENPEKAYDIAMGRTAGNNASHEAAVYHAVANDALTQAKKTGDYSKVTELATSPRHTAVSEAAQRLGAEGYNNPHDPIQLMNDVAKTRQKALGKRGGATVEKEAVGIKQAVQSSTMKVSRQDWHNFIESLKC